MLGPVFFMDMQRRHGRERLLFLRWVFALWLLFQFYYFFSGAEDSDGLVAAYYETLIVQHFLLLALVAPPFFAGTITEEKSLGALDLLLIADVSSFEIVVGRLASRYVQVGGVGLISLPL